MESDAAQAAATSRDLDGRTGEPACRGPEAQPRASAARAGRRTTRSGSPVARSRPISQVRLLQRWASKRPAGDLGGLRRGGRRGQLRVEEAAVAGEAAAGRRRRDVDLLGERAGERARARGRGRGGGRSRSGGRSTEPTLRVDLEARQQVLVAPTRSSRGSSSSPWRLGVLLGRGRRRRDSARPWVHEVASITTGSVPPPVQRQSVSTVSFAMLRVAVAIALRAPRRRAAGAGDVVGDPDRLAGARRDGDQRLGQRAARPASPLRAAEDPVDAGRQVDGGGAVAGRRAAASAAPAAASSPPLGDELGADARARPRRGRAAARRRDRARPRRRPQAGARARSTRSQRCAATQRHLLGARRVLARRAAP